MAVGITTEIDEPAKISRPALIIPQDCKTNPGIFILKARVEEMDIIISPTDWKCYWDDSGTLTFIPTPLERRAYQLCTQSPSIIDVFIGDLIVTRVTQSTYTCVVQASGSVTFHKLLG